MVSRIKQLLDWQQLSPTQFADRIGVGRPVMSHILSERNKPSLEVVQRIIAAFPELSLPWLLSGTGLMLDATDAVATPPAPTPEALAPAPAARPAPGSAPAPTVAPPVPAPFVASVVAVTQPAPTVSATHGERPAARPVVGPTPPRFRPGKPKVETAAEPTAVPAVSSVGDPVPVVTPPSPVPNTAAPVGAAAPPPTAPEAAPATPPASPLSDFSSALFGESGKAIRRIVIFYRDGSFADYQPEA